MQDVSSLTTTSANSDTLDINVLIMPLRVALAFSTILFLDRIYAMESTGLELKYPLSSIWYSLPSLNCATTRSIVLKENVSSVIAFAPVLLLSSSIAHRKALSTSRALSSQKGSLVRSAVISSLDTLSRSLPTSSIMTDFAFLRSASSSRWLS